VLAKGTEHLLVPQGTSGSLANLGNVSSNSLAQPYDCKGNLESSKEYNMSNTPLGSFQVCDNRKFSGNITQIRNTQKKYHEQMDFGQLHSIGHCLGAGTGDLNRVNTLYSVLSANMQARFRAYLMTEETLSHFFRVNIDEDGNVSFSMKKGWQKRLADADPDAVWAAINAPFRDFGDIKQDPLAKFTDFDFILKMIERAAKQAENGTENRPLAEEDAKLLQITVSERIHEFADELRMIRSKSNGTSNTEPTEEETNLSSVLEAVAS